MTSAAACWAAPQDTCPARLRESAPRGKGAGPLPGAAAEQAAADEQRYVAFAAAGPPDHWIFCHVSLAAGRRKKSPGIVALRAGAVVSARTRTLD